MSKIEDIKLLEKIIRGMDVTKFYEKELKQIIRDLVEGNGDLFWFEQTGKENFKWEYRNIFWNSIWSSYKIHPFGEYLERALEEDKKRLKEILNLNSLFNEVSCGSSLFGSNCPSAGDSFELTKEMIEQAIDNKGWIDCPNADCYEKTSILDLDNGICNELYDYLKDVYLNLFQNWAEEIKHSTWQMKDIVVTPKIKQIILFDYYDETFWNGILEQFKKSLINGNFSFYRDRVDEEDRINDRSDWFYHTTVVNGYYERPKLLRGQCIELIKETFVEPLKLSARCNSCYTENTITSFKELNLLCKSCQTGIHPYDGVFGDELDDFIYLLEERTYREHFLEKSLDIFNTHLQSKNSYYVAKYSQENLIKDKKLLYKLKLILPTEQEVWTGLDFSELEPNEVNEIKLQYRKFLTDLEKMLKTNYKIFAASNLDIIFKNNFYIPHWYLDIGFIDRDNTDWEKKVFEFKNKRNKFFDNQKINFKRNENILDISWECNEEITEVRLNKDNVEEMILHYIHDWHCG